ncbi:DUF2795 domain-containing protein [Streptomyces sp. NBC_00557]|jgi:hypothetical protein|uniref:DUF2795 domain-containing protein n=1 Tax=unclassified Streptomyces TaxID=2593676 RepID=UPI002E7FF008|nr:DUF2795 domain-containing protein [Streptomyces sp. NBC_00557]WUC33819.1 DUF2795 domain-containing protein [Streptomyces sp. NBC_00557]
MQRGSDRLNVHRDDEMKHELKGLLRSGHPTRVEEWHDPEPAADDDPEVWSGPVGGLGAPASLERVRSELARTLSRGSFPATARDLARMLRRQNAPGTLVDAVARLPQSARYENVQQLAEALVGGA